MEICKLTCTYTQDARIGAGGYRDDLLDLDPTKGKGVPSSPNGVPSPGAGMYSSEMKQEHFDDNYCTFASYRHHETTITTSR